MLTNVPTGLFVSSFSQISDSVGFSPLVSFISKLKTDIRIFHIFFMFRIRRKKGKRRADRKEARVLESHVAMIGGAPTPPKESKSRRRKERLDLLLNFVENVIFQKIFGHSRIHTSATAKITCWSNRFPKLESFKKRNFTQKKKIWKHEIGAPNFQKI